ncbi:MAG TPA: hypothetical protein PK024_13900 [Methanospirillum sp.]|uniref:hypothetical protein n=1 Tax=Methanospirillum sp. TaxID=45200 RepID=UPI002CBB1F1A|nr:hypothetical protein [Methanospirillum sp.]HOJ97919.1 hypothetical protein [Methanospirillum sp.]
MAEEGRYTDEKPRDERGSYRLIRDYSYNLCAYRAIKREIDDRTELAIRFLRDPWDI